MTTQAQSPAELEDPRPGREAVPIGPLVREFFSLLDGAGIVWAVLRGSDGLPDHTRYDIDLLVDPAQMDRAESLLAQAAASATWSVVRIVDKLKYRCCVAVSPGTRPRFLPIDLFGRCLHRFYPIADDAFALQNRLRRPGGVWVVPVGFGAALAVMKELMRHDVFKANSRDEVQHGAVSDPASFSRAVQDSLGRDLAARLLAACQSGAWHEVEGLAPEIRRAVQSQRFRHLPAAARFLSMNVRHHLDPPMSAFVALLGPDGAGKTTIADRVAEALYQRPFKRCCRFEYNFRLLPELKHFKNGASRLLGREVVRPSAPEPGTRGAGMNADHPPWRAMLYITYYALDLLAGRFVLRRLRAQGSLILFARYFHDYHYQRGYGRAPRWYLRLLGRIVPAPDLVLYLHRSAEEIYAGKPELDLDEIKRQQEVIQALIRGRSNAVVVDATGGVDRTVAGVCELIIGRLVQRHGGHRGRAANT